MDAFYETLEVKPGASAEEVKAAYRRLAKLFHPDSAGGGLGDSARFLEISRAYHALMAERSPRPDPSPADGPAQNPNAPARGLDWRFEGVCSKGPDVVYVLRLSPEAARTGLSLDLPWKKEDACPRCLGVGHTLVPIFGGPHLAKAPCLKCQAKGVILKNSTVRVDLRPAVIRRGRLRLTGLGHYHPALAQRGDLVIETLVDLDRGFGSGRLWVA